MSVRIVNSYLCGLTGALPDMWVGRRTSSDASDTSHVITWNTELTDRTNWWSSGTDITQPSGGSGLVRVSFAVRQLGAREGETVTEKNADPLVVGMAKQGNGVERLYNAATGAIIASATGDDYSTRINGTCDNASWMQVEEIDASLKYAVVYKSAAQSTTANAWTDLTWDLELSDVGGWHTGSSSDLVVPSGQGISLVRLTCNTVSYYFSGSTVADRFHFLRILRTSGSQAGMPYQGCQKQVNFSSNNVVSAIVAVADGDVFRASAYVSNTANNYGASAGSGLGNHPHYHTWFQIEEVDPATKYVLLKKVATQSLSAGVATALAFGPGSTVVDTDNAHSETVENTKIFIPPGCTEARATINYIGALVDGQVRAYAALNGAYNVPFPIMSQNITGQPEYLNGMGGWRPVDPTDYITFVVQSATAQTAPISDHTWICVEFR